MKKFTTSQRLKQIISERGIKQVDILEACQPFCKKYNVQLKKNDLSQYVSGRVEPKQDKLTILGLALNVNEVWLMGYDVPPERDALSKQQQSDEVYQAVQKTFGEKTAKLVHIFVELNEEGQERLFNTALDMSLLEHYKKGDSSGVAKEA